MRAALILATIVAVHTAAAKPPREPAITLTPAQAASLGAHIVQPEYPLEARRRGISGHGVFLIEAEIATGAVHRVSTRSSTGSAILDQSVLRALRQWRFNPAIFRSFQQRYARDKTEKYTRVVVPVTFTLRNA